MEEHHRDHGERADAVERRLVGERRVAVGRRPELRSSSVSRREPSPTKVKSRRPATNGSRRRRRGGARRRRRDPPGRARRTRSRRSRPRANQARMSTVQVRAVGGGGSRSRSRPARTGAGVSATKPWMSSSLTLPKMPQARRTSAGTAPTAASLTDASPVTTSTPVEPRGGGVRPGRAPRARGRAPPAGPSRRARRGWSASTSMTSAPRPAQRLSTRSRRSVGAASRASRRRSLDDGQAQPQRRALDVVGAVPAHPVRFGGAVRRGSRRSGHGTGRDGRRGRRSRPGRYSPAVTRRGGFSPPGPWRCS